MKIEQQLEKRIQHIAISLEIFYYVEILMQEYHVKMISFLTMNQNLLQFMRIIKQIKTYLKDKAETQK